MYSRGIIYGGIINVHRKVREYFRKRGMADRVLEFDVSSATVELAARALQCEPCRIAKTLSFRVGDRVVLVVAAGDAKIDNQNIKHISGKGQDAVPLRNRTSDRP